LTDHGPPGGGWPAPDVIGTPRLVLQPLREAHAEQAAAAFDDPALHTFTGGAPASVAELRGRYVLQSVGHSPDNQEGWLNWIIRRRTAAAELIGSVQATLRCDQCGLIAELAWVVAPAAQGAGIATESSAAVADWLRGQGVGRFTANIHPRHHASMAVARHLGMSPTEDVVDGETVWTCV
jgi:RimJ/RimL family protein N-acetyltransferase